MGKTNSPRAACVTIYGKYTKLNSAVIFGGVGINPQIKQLKHGVDVQALRSTLDRGLTAVVADGDTFYGLITRFDLLNHLRRTLS